MGNKAGYAHVILAALGLRSGEGASAYVWAESDPDVRALLRAYPDADMLRRIADIIRGWKDEEPRALWERLRAERKARNAQATHDVASEDEAAKVVFLTSVAYDTTRLDTGGFIHLEEGGRYGADRQETADRCHRLAEYATGCAEPAAWAWLQSRSVGGVPVSEGLPFYGPTMPAGDPKNALLGRRVATCDGVASGFERVAGWTLTTHWSIGTSGTGFAETSYAVKVTQETMADRYAASANVSRWPPVAVLATIPDAATLSALLGTPGDLDGVVVYSDPDYRDTTGYLSTCREMIPALARGWSDAGAVVCVSEAEPVPELAGWFATEISAGRRGQKRTFSKQQAEWLTMNREPAHRVAVQERMFGG